MSDETMRKIRRQESTWAGGGMAVLVVPHPDRVDNDKPLVEWAIHFNLRHIVKANTAEAW